MTNHAAYNCPACAETGVSMVLGAPRDRLPERIAEHHHWHHGEHPAEQRRTITINQPITFEVCSGCERVVNGPIGVASVPLGVTVTLTGDGSGEALPPANGRFVGSPGTLGWECGTNDPDCERSGCPVHRLARLSRPSDERVPEEPKP